MRVDRRMLLAVVAGIAVLSAGVGWFAGQRIKSPAEVAAEAAPPEPSLITVPIELRPLSQDVVIRGTITPSDETSLSATSTTGSGVVTALPKEPGAGITEGDVLVGDRTVGDTRAGLAHMVDLGVVEVDPVGDGRLRAE